MSLVLMLTTLLVSAPVQNSMTAQRSEESRSALEAEVRQVLSDYIRLYQRDTLLEWRRMFLPGFVAAFTNDDGSVTTRTFEQFYERQQKYFATGRTIREELRNVRLTVDGRLASAHADFVLFDNESQSAGKLVLTFVRERDQYMIHSLAFTYHLDQPKTNR